MAPSPFLQERLENVRAIVGRVAPDLGVPHFSRLRSGLFGRGPRGLFTQHWEGPLLEVREKWGTHRLFRFEVLNKAALYFSRRCRPPANSVSQTPLVVYKVGVKLP